MSCVGPVTRRRRSISAQSGGAEHVINVAVSFSTHRKAEMSSLGDYAAHFSPTLDEVSTL
jgi:hypothetical protein